MKNKIKFILILFYISLFFFNKVQSIEQFSFDVTEIEILENGNIIKGLKKGTKQHPRSIPDPS